MRRSYFPALALAAMALTVLAGGCISTKTDSAVADRLDSLGLSVGGIRQANLRTAYGTALLIEHAADSILSVASDRRIRANALIWKMYAVPAVRQIYSQLDPVAVSFDALAFAIQCEQYFNTGIGRDRFGEHQLIAIQTTVHLQDVLTDGLRGNLTQANFDTVLTQVDAWARNHPLQNHFFSRHSITRHLDSLISERDQSLGSAIGRIADNVDDLSGRLALVSGQLPREGR